jgi:prevent-host-death family protein
MQDHTARRRPAKKKSAPETNVVGVRELKTHAAGIVRHVREARASYVLTHRGRAVGVILPLEPIDELSSREDPSAAWDAFVDAGRRLERRFRADTGGVRELTRMRR